jgi:RimJ/RimL family protein N-acetyltransferase
MSNDRRHYGTALLGTERQFTARDGRAVYLRPAEPDDAEPLLDALNEVAAEGRYFLRPHWDVTPELEARWMGIALGSSDLLLVAFAGEDSQSCNIIAGCLSLVRGRPEYVRHTAELGMWLRAPYREIGIGSQMVEAALAWATIHAVEKITLSVRSGNRRAFGLYQKYGFAEEGRRRAFIKTPQGYEDEYLFSRFTSPLDPLTGPPDPPSTPPADPNRR